jgi:hypothetical protein
VCIFDVSGEILLSKELAVDNGELTIAGQTASTPGIVLRGAGVLIRASDVIVEHLAIRVGDDPSGPKPGERDGLRIGADGRVVERVLVDHLSVLWGIDENVSVVGQAKNITIRNTLIAEGLDVSIHPKGPHSKAILISPDSESISLLGNVIACNGERNPLVQPGSTIQFINNLVYGWGQQSKSSLFDISDSGAKGRGVTVDFIGNVYQPAPWGTAFAPIFAKPPVPSTRIFAFNNRAPTRTNESEDEWNVVDLPKDPYQSLTPNLSNSLQIAYPVDQVLKRTLAFAGARPALRSQTDQRIISDVSNVGGTIKDCIVGCARAVGRWPKVVSRLRKNKLPKGLNSELTLTQADQLALWLEERRARLLPAIPAM